MQGLFTPAGFVAKVRSILRQTFLRGCYNVQDYGATGNGVTDDTLAFQRAATACSAGGVYYVPPGTYLLSNTIVFASSGTTVQGAAISGTTIRLANSATNNAGPTSIFLFSGLSSCTVRDIKFDGNNTNQSSFTTNAYAASTTAGIACVEFSGGDNNLIERCTLTNSPWAGVMLRDTTCFTVRDVQGSSNGFGTVYALGVCTGSNVTGVKATTDYCDSIRLKGPGGITVSGNRCYSARLPIGAHSGFAGIYVEYPAGGGTQLAYDYAITNNICNLNSGNGIDVNVNSDATVPNPHSQAVTITGNTCRANLNGGIVARGHGCVIGSNNCTGNGTNSLGGQNVWLCGIGTALSWGCIVGNNCDSNVGFGVKTISTVFNVLLTSNVISNNIAGTISGITNGVNSCTVTNNSFA